MSVTDIFRRRARGASGASPKKERPPVLTLQERRLLLGVLLLFCLGLAARGLQLRAARDAALQNPANPPTQPENSP